MMRLDIKVNNPGIRDEQHCGFVILRGAGI